MANVLLNPSEGITSKSKRCCVFRLHFVEYGRRDRFRSGRAGSRSAPCRCIPRTRRCAPPAAPAGRCSCRRDRSAARRAGACAPPDCCARISPSSACSGKFFEPMTMRVGAARAATGQQRSARRAESDRAAIQLTNAAARNLHRWFIARAAAAVRARSARNPRTQRQQPPRESLPPESAELFTIARPRKMNSPRPPAPTAAAMVATPMVSTVATRMPASTVESESGSSTCHKIWRVGHAHAARRFAHRRIDARDSRRGVADDRQQRVERQRRDGQRGRRARPATAREAEIRAAPGSGIVSATLALPRIGFESHGRRATRIPSGTPMAMASSHGGAHQPDMLERGLQNFVRVLREKLRSCSLAPLKFFERRAIAQRRRRRRARSSAEIPAANRVPGARPLPSARCACRAAELRWCRASRCTIVFLSRCCSS